MPVNRCNPTSTMSSSDHFEAGFNQLLKEFDASVSNLFHEIDTNFAHLSHAFDKLFFPSQQVWRTQFYNDIFMPVPTHSGSKCFVRHIERSPELSQRIQHTMIAVRNSVYEWEGNVEFKESFDSFFKKLEYFERNRNCSPAVLDEIHSSKALVERAALAYDSLAQLDKEVRSHQNQLNLQEPSNQRDALLQTVNEALQELNQCVLPEKLTPASVSKYTTQADELISIIKNRLTPLFGEMKSAVRQDVKVTHSTAKNIFSQKAATDVAEYTAAQPSVSPAVSQVNVAAQRNEVNKIIDQSIERYKTFFAEAQRDGISVKTFDHLYQMRISFWENQKEIGKICFTIEELLQWQANLEEAVAVDKILFEQFEHAFSYPNQEHCGNIARVKLLTKDILHTIDCQVPASTPLSFDQLSTYVKESPAAGSLKAKLGALEALLLADRRLSTLQLEKLANKPKYETLIDTYKTILKENNPYDNLQNEALQVYVSRWNEANALAKRRLAEG